MLAYLVLAHIGRITHPDAIGGRQAVVHIGRGWVFFNIRCYIHNHRSLINAAALFARNQAWYV